MNRLIVGSGTVKREGWYTLDANEANQPNFRATIPPVPDAVKALKWDVIEWIHGVGSLYPWEAAQTLKELKDCLATGGELVLEQPDLSKVAAHLATDLSLVWCLHGDPEPQDPLHMNKWTYTQQELCQLLRHCGFSITAVKPPQHHAAPWRDFRVEARA